MALDPAEAARVEAALDEAQRKTRAPVVCVLARASMAVEAEFLLGACLLALAAPAPLLVLTHLSAQRIYIAQLVVAILAGLIGSIPWLRRRIVPKRAQRSACHRAALAQFALRALDDSQQGVLVYVSLAERYVRILPAEEAARAVSQDQWQAAVNAALEPLAAGETEAALTYLADRCSDLLAKPFPPGPDWQPPRRRRLHLV